MVAWVEHRGLDYRDLLALFHKNLEPKSYLEVGTRNGGTLQLASCPAIAIDPQFAFQASPTLSRSETLLYQITSDEFFARFDPSVLLGGKIDLTFLDGLHQAETLLRDFFNVEAFCKPNSVIMMHDCIPTNKEMTVRVDNGGMWTGDVWKIVPILRRYRPDLKISCFDAGPTGLVTCTGLDPNSTVLRQEYFNIISEWSSIELEQYGFDRMINEASLVETKTIERKEEMARFFWL